MRWYASDLPIPSCRAASSTRSSRGGCALFGWPLRCCRRGAVVLVGASSRVVRPSVVRPRVEVRRRARANGRPRGRGRWSGGGAPASSGDLLDAGGGGVLLEVVVDPRAPHSGLIHEFSYGDAVVVGVLK